MFPRLRFVGLGGERTPKSIAERWAAEVMLYALYGTTECVGYQTAHALQVGGGSSALACLGSPISPSTQLLVRVGNGPSKTISALAAAGGADEAELLLAGPQVGSGYLGLPEQTSAVFLTTDTGDLCFATGDLLRVAAASAAGTASLRGRRDGMLKVNGNRIEAGEIESALLGALAPLVTAAAVIKHRGRLVAWATPGPASTSLPPNADKAVVERLAGDIARYFVAKAVPRHAVPTTIHFIDVLPLGGSGKVARSELLDRSEEAWCSQYRSHEGTDAVDPALNAVQALGIGNDTAYGGWAAVLAAVWISELDLPPSVFFSRTHGPICLCARTPMPRGRGWGDQHSLRPVLPFRHSLSIESDFRAVSGDSLVALRICHAAKAAFSKTANGGTREDDGHTGGVFGEGLGALAPGEMLSRPILRDHAEYLEAELGSVGTQDAKPPPPPSLGAAGAEIAALADRAARLGASELLILLADRCNADRDLVDRHELINTAMPGAVASGSYEAVRLLLDRGASAKSVDVLAAAQAGGERLLKLVVAAGADPRQRDREQQTCLHRAARIDAGRKVVELLLHVWSGAGADRGRRAAGPDPCSVVDKWGRTPLHWAVVNGHRTTTVALLAAKASPYAIDNAGETPLAVAERRAQCRAVDRGGLRPSVFGDIATLLGGKAKTEKAPKA